MVSFLLAIVIFLFSVILHEVAHGTVADYLGDPTAKTAGRLTLNPLKHLDPMGSIFLPLMLILLRSNIIVGWARPVPVNPFNLRDKRYGGAKVAVAGPAVNILVAIIFGLAVRFLPLGDSMFSQNLVLVFSYICWINLLLAVFNLTPVPPLDGSHILFTFLPHSLDNLKMFLFRYGFFILIFYIFLVFPFLARLVNWIFNLIVGGSFI